MGKPLLKKIGKLHADIIRKFLWFHSPNLYNMYDTYAKMKRYRNEWNGVSSINIYGGVEK